MTAAASVGWRLGRGATVEDAGVRFALWAPAAERVDLRILSGEGRGERTMDRDADGTFTAFVPGAGAGTDYQYRIDGGELWVPDPVSRHLPQGVHGPTRVVDPGAFGWSDEPWAGRAMADLVVYELHVGTFSDEGTFDGVIAHLDELVALGVTAVELMPVAQFPGTRNWGYDGVSPYAVQESYGGPEGLRRLVAAAHAAGLAVVLDVVYNHLGPEGNYLPLFGPYFTERYRTPWGAALNYDGTDSDEVRRYVVDNAVYWISEYHVDALRLDAVHSIFDFGARHILEEIGDAVHAEGEHLGRTTLVIAESDLNDPRLVRPKERGGYGLDAQWSDDFHHAVHALLTGERSGYYEDFGAVDQLARAIRERFVYAGHYSPHRRRRHGAPATDVEASRFVVSIQNHDQVGNRAAGERFGALLPAASQRLGAALLLLSPNVPMLWMGEEYGETNPFQYFVSHGDPELIESVRKGRRSEFAAFDWETDVPDPQDEATCRRSRLDRSKRAREPHAGILRLYEDLLGLRRREPALRPGDADVEVHFDGPGAWIAVRLEARGAAPLLAVFCFDEAAGPAGVPLVLPGRWRLLLTTDDARYGGQGIARSDGTRLVLSGRGAGLFRGDDS